MNRSARFAGSWYPGDAGRLRSLIDGLIEKGGPAKPAAGLIAPHAGYAYSGPVAALGYAAVDVPDTVVVLAVAHRSAGAEVAVWDEGAWETPLGPVETDAVFAAEVIRRLDSAEADLAAHMPEHSIELQLPFIKTRNPAARIVPVLLATRDPATIAALGRVVAELIEERGLKGRSIIVASSDMTHFEPAETARKKDALALEMVERLDPDGLLSTVRARGISMCGAAPSAAMMHAALALGAKRAEVISYAHSGEVTGDDSDVVGYAAVALRI